MIAVDDAFTFKAHTFMLYPVSPPFSVMLSGSYKDDVIEVPDVEPEAFKQILRLEVRQ